MVLAADFEKLVFNKRDGIDEVIAVGGLSLGNRDAAQELSDLCKLNASGFVATIAGHSSQMLIYPSGAERWKFLDGPGWKYDAIFDFRIFRSLPAAEMQPHTDDKRPSAVAVGEDLVQLDTDRMVNKNGQLDVKTVFLMFPPTHQAELEVCIHYFSALSIKVYHSAKPGAWTYFRKTHGGSSKSMLVVHPDVPIWQIPGLHNFLQMGPRVFRVGTSSAAPHLGLSCDRLFGIGTAVYITDDVFAYHPEAATEVIQAFLHENTRKPEGGEFNRIVARPGIKSWLKTLSTQQSRERGQKDSRWVKLYDAVCQLCPADDEDTEDLFDESLSTSYLVSIAPELLPSFEGLWERNEEQATEFMVNWFAGWSVENADMFKKFYIAHEPRSTTLELGVDPKGWASRYQHLAVRRPKDVWKKLAK
jgi:chromo domain-containing protein 1